MTKTRVEVDKKSFLVDKKEKIGLASTFADECIMLFMLQKGRVHAKLSPHESALIATQPPEQTGE